MMAENGFGPAVSGHVGRIPNYGKTQVNPMGTMEPPACIQNAMMTKDKKPFTYTPGGLDLSQIKTPSMARRMARQRSLEEQEQAYQQANGGNYYPQSHGQGAPFPPPPPPPSVPAPPPPPPLVINVPESKSPNPKPIAQGERPEIVIPENPIGMLRKTNSPYHWEAEKAEIDRIGPVPKFVEKAPSPRNVQMQPSSFSQQPPQMYNSAPNNIQRQQYSGYQPAPDSPVHKPEPHYAKQPSPNVNVPTPPMRDMLQRQDSQFNNSPVPFGGLSPTANSAPYAPTANNNWKQPERRDVPNTPQSPQYNNRSQYSPNVQQYPQNNQYSPNQQQQVSNNQRNTPIYQPQQPSPTYAQNNQQYNPPNNHQFAPNTQQFSPNTHQFSPNTHQFSPNTQQFLPNTQQFSPNTQQFSPTYNTPSSGPNYNTVPRTNKQQQPQHEVFGVHHGSPQNNVLYLNNNNQGRPQSPRLDNSNTNWRQNQNQQTLAKPKEPENLQSIYHNSKPLNQQPTYTPPWKTAQEINNNQTETNPWKQEQNRNVNCLPANQPQQQQYNPPWVNQNNRTQEENNSWKQQEKQSQEQPRYQSTMSIPVTPRRKEPELNYNKSAPQKEVVFVNQEPVYYCPESPKLIPPWVKTQKEKTKTPPPEWVQRPLERRSAPRELMTPPREQPINQEPEWVKKSNEMQRGVRELISPPRQQQPAQPTWSTVPSENRKSVPRDTNSNGSRVIPVSMEVGDNRQQTHHQPQLRITIGGPSNQDHSSMSQPTQRIMRVLSPQLVRFDDGTTQAELPTLNKSFQNATQQNQELHKTRIIPIQIEGASNGANKSFGGRY